MTARELAKVAWYAAFLLLGLANLYLVLWLLGGGS